MIYTITLRDVPPVAIPVIQRVIDTSYVRECGAYTFTTFNDADRKRLLRVACRFNCKRRVVRH